MNIPEDPIIAHSRRATLQLLAEISARPAAQRAAYLRRELSVLDPALPAKVERVAADLSQKGYTADAALVRAIEIEAANSLLNRFVQEGRSSLSGLGSAGADVGNFFLNLAGGAACSDALRGLVVDKVGSGSGRDAASLAAAGSDALRGAARCGGAAVAPAPPVAPAPLPAPPVAAPKMPIWPFIAGGVALVGVVVFVKMRG